MCFGKYFILQLILDVLLQHDREMPDCGSYFICAGMALWTVLLVYI